MGTEGTMRELFYLSTEQLERIKPFFPRSHGIPRLDDIKVVSFMSSGMACNGKMHPPNTDRIKHLAIALYDGAGWDFSTTFLTNWQKMQKTAIIRWLTPHISRLTEQLQVCSKKGYFAMYRAYKRRIEHKTPCRLHWRWKASGFCPHGRSGK